MPVPDNHAGVECRECNFVKAFRTLEEATSFEAGLETFDGYPVCPECGHYLTACDYIDG